MSSPRGGGPDGRWDVRPGEANVSPSIKTEDRTLKPKKPKPKKSEPKKPKSTLVSILQKPKFISVFSPDFNRKTELNPLVCVSAHNLHHGNIEGAIIE
jgi:hypothetical protein